MISLGNIGTFLAQIWHLQSTAVVADRSFAQLGLATSEPPQRYQVTKLAVTKLGEMLGDFQRSFGMSNLHHLFGDVGDHK